MYKTSSYFHTYNRFSVIASGICAVILTVGIARFSYTPFLPNMLRQTDLTTVSGGWLATFNYCGYLLGVIIVSLSTSLNFKYRFYRWCLVFAVVTTVLMGMTTNLYWWSALRFISGMTSIAGVILSSGFVLNWLRHEGYLAKLGLHFSGLGLGIALPGILVVWMNLHFDWSMQWQLMGWLGVLFLIPAWLWMPAPTLHAHKPASQTTEPEKRWQYLMIAAYFCAGVGYVVSATFIVAILEAMPILAGKGDWIWVMLGLAAVPSCFIWDRLSLKLGDLPTLLLAYLVQCVAIIIPALFDSTIMNLMGAMLFGFTFSGIVSLMLTLIGHKFPNNPPKAMAKLTISYGIAQIIAPAITGYWVKLSGGYHSALWGATLILAAGLVLLLLAYRLDRKAAAA